MTPINIADRDASNNGGLRLLIVDDQPLIRRGLAMMLGSEPGIEIVGQAANGDEAVQMALATAPDVVVMDLQMPLKSGVVATREIRAAQPQTRVIVLTTYDDDELVCDALCAGAQAYLLKDVSEAEVLDTIRAVNRGESRLSPKIARKVIDQFRTIVINSRDQSRQVTVGSALLTLEPTTSHEIENSLTEKEKRVLELISQGKSNKQIAGTVFLAEGTVKNYVSRIMDKLHAHSRTELAVRAADRCE